MIQFGMLNQYHNKILEMVNWTEEMDLLHRL